MKVCSMNPPTVIPLLNLPADEEQGASAKFSDLTSLKNDFRPQPNSTQKLLSKVKKNSLLEDCIETVNNGDNIACFCIT